MKMGSVPIYANYLKYLNKTDSNEELEILRKSINKNIPFGGNIWVDKMVNKFKIEQSLRKVSMPKKNRHNTHYPALSIIPHYPKEIDNFLNTIKI